MSDSAVAAIEYALNNDEPEAFLRCWFEGNFDAIRREWENVPEEVFIGADPFHPETKKMFDEPSVPEGYKLVPIELTPEMVEACYKNWQYGDKSARDIWRDMLAAAPEIE